MSKRTHPETRKNLHTSRAKGLGFFFKNPKRAVTLGTIVVIVLGVSVGLASCVCMRDGTVNNSAALDADVDLNVPE